MVVIFLGSKSDLDWGKEIGKNLDSFGIKYKMHIASAHKTPEYLLSLLQRYEKLKPPKVYICVAGRSNALGGMVDANVSSPVINCPPYSEKYKGMDILSSLRMPSGVSPLTVLEPEQAALAAVKILSENIKKLKNEIITYQKKAKEKIIKGNKFNIML
jgi:5-(carboxyamino)imidazole ribonucleotide mutase